MLGRQPGADPGEEARGNNVDGDSLAASSLFELGRPKNAAL